MSVYLQHNAAFFKSLFEILQAYMAQVTLRFETDALRISGVDTEKVVLVTAILDKLDTYKCDSLFEFGVETAFLYKALRGVGKDDIIQITSNGGNTIELVVDGPGSKTTHHLRALDLPKQDISYPPVVFDSVVRIGTKSLLKTLREMACVGKYVTIYHSADQGAHELFFRSNSDNGSAFLETTDVEWLYRSEEGFSGKYINKFIERFLKPNLKEFVEVNIKTDYPLMVTYPLEVGEIKLAISPQNEA